MKSLSFLLIGFLISMSCSSGNAKTYSNEDWEMTIPYPPKAGLCPIPHQSGQSHGPYFLLDQPHPTRAICQDNKPSRSISVFALYAVTDTDYSLPDFSATYCSYEEPPQKCEPGPDHLQFGPLESQSERIELVNGWIRIDVFALGEMTMDSTNTWSHLGYIASLYTDKIHYESDLVLFQAFLNRVKVRVAH